MCKTQKKKTFHFITLSQEKLKVQYIFEERLRSMHLSLCRMVQLLETKVTESFCYFQFPEFSTCHLKTYHLLIACLWYLSVRLAVLVLGSSAFFLFISILFPVVIVLHCSSWFSYSRPLFCWLLFTCLKVHNFLFICLKVNNFLFICLKAHSFLFICSKVHNYGAVGWEQNIGSSWARNSAQSLSLKINI